MANGEIELLQKQSWLLLLLSWFNILADKANHRSNPVLYVVCFHPVNYSNHHHVGRRSALADPWSFPGYSSPLPDDVPLQLYDCFDTFIRFGTHQLRSGTENIRWTITQIPRDRPTLVGRRVPASRVLRYYALRLKAQPRVADVRHLAGGNPQIYVCRG